jgi:hypothetical protein
VRKVWGLSNDFPDDLPGAGVRSGTGKAYIKSDGGERRLVGSVNSAHHPVRLYVTYGLRGVRKGSHEENPEFSCHPI